MRTSILIITFCAIASFAVAQKSDKDRKAGLKPLKQTETKSEDDRPMRKIASGRGEEELEEQIEMELEGLDEEIERDIERSLEGLDEEIERSVEMSLEGLDEQIEMSIEASMEGLDEALEALDHLDFDFDVRVNDEMVDVHEIVREAIEEAKVEVRDAQTDVKVNVKTKSKSKPKQ